MLFETLEIGDISIAIESKEQVAEYKTVTGWLEKQLGRGRERAVAGVRRVPG